PRGARALDHEAAALGAGDDGRALARDDVALLGGALERVADAGVVVEGDARRRLDVVARGEPGGRVLPGDDAREREERGRADGEPEPTGGLGHAYPQLKRPLDGRSPPPLSGRR